jgi:hypothetical protein
LVSREASEAKRLVDEVSKKNDQAEQKLSSLDKAVDEGNRAVLSLREYTAFNSTVLAAQNDDRRAYDQLWKFGDDETSPFRKAATQAVQTIMDQHNPSIVRGGFTVPWKEGVDPQRLTAAEIWEAYRQAPPDVRIAVLEFMWQKRTDIPKKERLGFLADALRNEESLNVVEYAGRWFAQGTGDQLKPLAIPQHLKWWDENKDSVE